MLSPLVTETILTNTKISTYKVRSVGSTTIAKGIIIKGMKKNDKNRKVGRPEKRTVESIPDTPENVAKSLFGIAPDGKKVKEMKP